MPLQYFAADSAAVAAAAVVETVGVDFVGTAPSWVAVAPCPSVVEAFLVVVVAVAVVVASHVGVVNLVPYQLVHAEAIVGAGGPVENREDAACEALVALSFLL